MSANQNTTKFVTFFHLTTSCDPEIKTIRRDTIIGFQENGYNKVVAVFLDSGGSIEIQIDKDQFLEKMPEFKEMTGPFIPGED